ncbi:MAG: radical SAM family heme chaperone HemW [Culturomica sp.]|jgi:oxygen-independent coproporphyrinogen-3 oxidase|nr:radical SAM family heme chaperone HemW [Culturomica sp.]
MIYVHIPFCKSKCYYCGFYSTVSSSHRKEYFEALVKEIYVRKNFLGDKKATNTLYIGGGTPSQLASDEIHLIMDALNEKFIFAPNAEKTIEINPDDVNRKKLELWKECGFNRVSIGAQTFNNASLKAINRRHTGEQARIAVLQAAEAGFDNISIDLIMGLPNYTLNDLEKDLKIVLNLPVVHISSYMLSIDLGSVFYKWRQAGKLKKVSDDVLADMYELMCITLKNNDFDHYEISNFAKNDRWSRHNVGYWQGKSYIGLGAAAHSYDQHRRYWNVSNIFNYIDHLNRDVRFYEWEELREHDKYNEYLMTTLRTKWGADIDVLFENYAFEWERSQSKIKSYIANGYAYIKDNHLILTEAGWLISDKIINELFFII